MHHANRTPAPCSILRSSQSTGTASTALTTEYNHPPFNGFVPLFRPSAHRSGRLSLPHPHGSRHTRRHAPTPDAHPTCNPRARALNGKRRPLAAARGWALSSRPRPQGQSTASAPSLSMSFKILSIFSMDLGIVRRSFVPNGLPTQVVTRILLAASKQSTFGLHAVLASL